VFKTEDINKHLLINYFGFISRWLSGIKKVPKKLISGTGILLAVAIKRLPFKSPFLD